MSEYPVFDSSKRDVLDLVRLISEHTWRNIGYAAMDLEPWNLQMLAHYSASPIVPNLPWSKCSPISFYEPLDHDHMVKITPCFVAKIGFLFSS